MGRVKKIVICIFSGHSYDRDWPSLDFSADLAHFSTGRPRMLSENSSKPVSSIRARQQ